jgi:hypothetical protein
VKVTKERGRSILAGSDILTAISEFVRTKRGRFERRSTAKPAIKLPNNCEINCNIAIVQNPKMCE